MNRENAIAHAIGSYESGLFYQQLRARVARRTESQSPHARAALLAYLQEDLAPQLESLGFSIQLLTQDIAGEVRHFLLAQRIEGEHQPTALMYGHGDVVPGMEERWSQGRSPWELRIEGDRWYGRGTADNKGQHTINLLALASVLAQRKGRLGFNLKILFEMGEEIGSPCLASLCSSLRDELRADVFIASDGPRLRQSHPTLFLGSRGIVNFSLDVHLRESGFHSGNWGGLLRNPATTLAAALTSLVDGQGVIQVPGLRPPAIAPSVRMAVADLVFEPQEGDPAIDENWGEPGLTPQERVFAWNTMEILSMQAGGPGPAVNAIAPRATAQCQLRFVVGTDWQALETHVRSHLDAHGLSMVQVKVARGAPATRLDPQSPWVQWAVRSMQASTGKKVDLLPNLGGTLPNEIFAQTLGLPTLWLPHSYPACAQHAPDEHLLGSLAKEGLAMMAGLWWDLGEPGVKGLSEFTETA